jgi:hypothetical protein
MASDSSLLWCELVAQLIDFESGFKEQLLLGGGAEMP